MDARTEARRESDAKSANEQTLVKHLSLQLMRQDSLLSAVEAAQKARQLYRRGVRDLWR